MSVFPLYISAPVFRRVVFTTAASVWTLLCATGAPALAQVPAETPPPTPKLKDEQRIPWSRSDEWFRRDWLVAGPFAAALEQDALTEHGGEAAIHPKADLAHKRADGTAVSWKAFKAWGDAVNLEEAFGVEAPDSGVGYAFATITRPAAGRALLSLGSDDGVRVWVNGALVHERRSPRPLVPDEDRVEVPMNAGENAVLVKVEQRRGPWAFCLRVLEAGAAPAPVVQIGPAALEEESTPTSLVLRTDAATPAPGGADVKAEVVAPGGVVVAALTRARGAKVAFDVKAWPDGPYEVRFTTRTVAGKTWATHVPWFKGDVRARARQVVDQGKKAEDATPAGMIRRMLADLVLDRAAGDLDKAGAEALRRTHAALMEAAELDLEAAGRTGRVHGHGFVRLAWRDDVDGSVQFARVYLPPGYRPGRRRPMIVNLHGYNPANPVYVRWWAVDSRHHAIHAEDRGEDGPIYVDAHGRGNTAYQGLGEKDVLRVIAEAKKALAVDESRVYLMGDSMGGWGTWQVGTRHPELFAAIAPIFGGSDYHAELDEATLARLAPQERFVWERRSSFAQAEDLLSLPILIEHGDADKSVNVEYSRWIVKMLQRWGYDVRYRELPGRGHEDMKIHGEVHDWLLRHRRVASPRHVRVRSAELQSAAAYWVRLTRAEDPMAFLLADAEVVGPNRIRLDTSNVRAATLTPGPLVDAAKPVEVIWNGVPRSMRGAEGRLELRAEGDTPGTRAKDWRVPGPFGDVVNTPFAVVVGTVSPDPAMRRMCEWKARGFVDFWKDWQKVAPRVFKDTELTDADAGRYSLLLIGGPADNAVTKRLAGSLPLQVRPDAIVIDGTSFPVSDAAVGLVYPNPLNPGRYVGVVAGTSAGGLWFWEPGNREAGEWDCFIVDGRTDVAAAALRPGRFPERGRVVSGWFDRDWRLREAALVRGDSELRAKAVPIAPPKLADVDPLAFDALVGRYDLGGGIEVRVWREGNHLFGAQGKEGAAELLPESDTEYFILQQNVRLVFEKDAAGKLTGMLVKLPGQEVRGRKVE